MGVLRHLVRSVDVWLHAGCHHFCVGIAEVCRDGDFRT